MRTVGFLIVCLDAAALTEVPKHWAPLRNEYFAFSLCMCNESLAVKIFYVLQNRVVDLGRLPDIHSASLSLPQPQHDRRRKYDEKAYI